MKFDDERWKRVADYNFPLLFSTRHGRDWWASSLWRLSELFADVGDYGDEILSELGPPTCSADVEIILNADRHKSGAM